GRQAVNSLAAQWLIVGPRARAGAGEIDHGLARGEKRRADGGMLGPIHRAIEAELIFELAIDRNHLFAIGDLKSTRECFMNDGEIRAHGDRSDLAVTLGLESEYLRVRFAVARQPGGFFLWRNRPEAIDTDENARAASVLRGAPQFASHTHGIPQRVEFFRIFLQYD